MKITFDSQTIDLTPVSGADSGKAYRATIEDKAVDIEVLRSEEGRLDLLIDGKRTTAYVSSDGAKRWVTVKGQTFVLTKSSGATMSSKGRGRGAGHERVSELAAPMPGQVRSINVSEGEAVTRGQTLIVLEAMKMEIRIQAPGDGKVKKLYVKPGQTVEREQILVEIE